MIRIRHTPRLHRGRSLLAAVVALALAAASGGLMACAGSNPGDNNQTNQNGYISDCDESNVSGHYLTALGDFSTQVPTGATVDLKAMVIQLDDGSGTLGGVVPDQEVTFEIISVLGDGTLSASSAVSDGNGIATVEFTGNEEADYQIVATAEGTCSVTFTVSVADQLRGLRVVGPNPVITETNRRINVSVQAYSPDPGFGEYPLVGEQITFQLGTGGTGTMLSDIGGTTTGDQVVAATNPQGIATVQMETGTAVVSNGVEITATLAGTAPVTVNVKIQESGTGPCTTNADCPAAFPLCDNGSCVENPVQSGPCQTNDDCISPYVCLSGSCIAPNTNGDPCSPVAANPCPDPNEVCIAGYCTDIPTGDPCTTNDDCPTGWLCINGTCEQDTPPGEDPCIENGDCQSGFVCVGGTCIPDTQCTNPQPPDRLNGTWSFDSTLHLRDALSGFVDAIFTGFEFLRDAIQGNLDIPGIPSIVESFVQSLIQSIVQAYVPPWGQQLIIAVGNISDIIDDMRVYSTVNLVPQGNYEYLGAQTWDIVEFEYQGQLITENPANIPEIGTVPQQNFTSREVCGIFFIDRYDVPNVVGGLVRWAIEVVLTAVTCSGGGPCYYSLEDALEDIIDCDAIAWEIDDLVYNSFGLEVYDAVYNFCDAGKAQAITAIIDALDNITIQLNLMSMRGQADIVTSSFLDNGRWYGSLAGGSYDGEFTATRQ